MLYEPGLPCVPATRNRQWLGHLLWLQGGHLVGWGHAVSACGLWSSHATPGSLLCPPCSGSRLPGPAPPGGSPRQPTIVGRLECGAAVESAAPTSGSEGCPPSVVQGPTRLHSHWLTPGHTHLVVSSVWMLCTENSQTCTLKMLLGPLPCAPHPILLCPELGCLAIRVRL